MKKVLQHVRSGTGHWVGNGFPVRTLFNYNSHATSMSPFLLLDYAGPHTFEPGNRPRGVGKHPHRGFETVTIVYQGEVAHKDSAGNGGVIGPGDVQWMTAGAGILHEEFHSPVFTESGGPLEMVQLWVNLPARDKHVAPGYQGIEDQQIPEARLPDGAGYARVIAGEYGNASGPAQTYTPMNVWDLRLNAGSDVLFELPQGWTAGVVVLRGEVIVNGEVTGQGGEAVILDREGANVHLTSKADAVVLLLSGAPIEEPVVGQGPFVMNTANEIRQAIDDLQSGRFGAMAD